MCSPDELLDSYGQLISYTMNVAKGMKDKREKERMVKDMERHIRLFNKETADRYERGKQ